jgi:methionyl-tRNA formyltransferase
VPLRIVFCGTPAFAAPSLRHLIAQPDFEIVSVVTQPDRPRGRGNQISISPVKAIAIESGIPVYQPEKIKSVESLDYFKRLAPDVVVIIAYGQIISARLIEIPRLGWINLHASLLPKYRGAAPINWAILNNEKITGLTTMQIDAGLDTGPMLLQYETPIGPDETAPELTARLAEAGAPLMAETLRKLDGDELFPVSQANSEATFAPLLRKNDGLIEWELSAEYIYNRIRGLQPWPGAFTTFRGKNCQIWGRPLSLAVIASSLGLVPVGVVQPNRQTEFPPVGVIHSSRLGIWVQCGSAGALVLEYVQLEGRNRITAQEFVNGAHLEPGERFGI